MSKELRSAGNPLRRLPEGLTRLHMLLDAVEEEDGWLKSNEEPAGGRRRAKS